MFILENNKQTFINRANKHKFNSVIIPTSLQKPMVQNKQLYLHKINNLKKINHIWYKTSLSKQMKQQEIKQLEIKEQEIKTKKYFKVVINNAKFAELVKRGMKKQSISLTQDNITTKNNNSPEDYNIEYLHLSEDCLSIDKEPDAPLNLTIIPDNNAIIITFTEPYSKTEVVNYLYSIDWSDFEPFVPVQNKSPVTITNIENGESYVIALKAQNKYGISNTSLPVQTFIGLLGFDEK